MGLLPILDIVIFIKGWLTKLERMAIIYVDKYTEEYWHLWIYSFLFLLFEHEHSWVSVHTCSLLVPVQFYSPVTCSLLSPVQFYSLVTCSMLSPVQFYSSVHCYHLFNFIHLLPVHCSYLFNSTHLFTVSPVQFYSHVTCSLFSPVQFYSPVTCWILSPHTSPPITSGGYPESTPICSLAYTNAHIIMLSIT